MRGATGGGGGGAEKALGDTLGGVVSVTELTTYAAWMLGLALVALVLAGWRKNARASVKSPRADQGVPTTVRRTVGRDWAPIGVAETTTPLYKRPGPIRRIWAVVASSGIAIVIGAVLATVVAFGLAYLVITLTDLLRQ
ncbi:MAG: hypothetical protein AAGA42_06895 [Actinomycetota bacterium]